MDKLRLKNSAMRVKEQKLQMQLKQVWWPLVTYLLWYVTIMTFCCTHLQKEEAGDVRHEVDYEQLKIENQQLSEHMENKNRELLRLKVSAGRTMQVLNSYKVIFFSRANFALMWIILSVNCAIVIVEKGPGPEHRVTPVRSGNTATECAAREDTVWNYSCFKGMVTTLWQLLSYLEMSGLHWLRRKKRLKSWAKQPDTN